VCDEKWSEWCEMSGDEEWNEMMVRRRGGRRRDPNEKQKPHTMT